MYNYICNNIITNTIACNNIITTFVKQNNYKNFAP